MDPDLQNTACGSETLVPRVTLLNPVFCPLAVHFTPHPLPPSGQRMFVEEDQQAPLMDHH